MSRLSDRVKDAVQSALSEAGGVVVVHTVATSLLPELTDDERDQVALEGLSSRIKASAARGRAQMRATAGMSQPELPFNLARAYAVDIDERQIKPTRDLSRTEVKRIITIREQSIDADMRSLSELKNAYTAVAPHWDRSPAKSFGEVLDIAAISVMAAE